MTQTSQEIKTIGNLTEELSKLTPKKEVNMKVEGKVKEKKEKSAPKKESRPKYFHSEHIKNVGGKKIFDQTKVKYTFASQAIRDMLKKNGIEGIDVQASPVKKEVLNPSFDKTKEESKENPKKIKVEAFRVTVKDKENIIKQVQYSTEEILGRHIMNIIYAVGNLIHSGELDSFKTK